MVVQADSEDEYDRKRNRDRDRDAKKSGSRKQKPDYKEMLQKGQKGWQKVEPVAKPMLAALAQQYLK